jgi:hypothetical protein
VILLRVVAIWLLSESPDEPCGQHEDELGKPLSAYRLKQMTEELGCNDYFGTKNRSSPLAFLFLLSDRHDGLKYLPAAFGKEDDPRFLFPCAPERALLFPYSTS